MASEDAGWSALIDSTDGGQTRYALLLRGRRATYGEVVAAWRRDESFRALFTGLLRDSRYRACYFETPAVCSSSVDRPFEFVLIGSDLLAGVDPEPEAFSEHFSDALEEPVVTFPNLGGDAILVAPCPVGPPQSYPHLAAFVRDAPVYQQHALWRRVGEAVDAWIGETPDPVWVSTAGQGVFWLHVRLDSRPKYYNHAPYRRP
jgi:hypothetical protein